MKAIFTRLHAFLLDRAHGLDGRSTNGASASYKKEKLVTESLDRRPGANLLDAAIRMCSNVEENSRRYFRTFQSFQPLISLDAFVPRASIRRSPAGEEMKVGYYRERMGRERWALMAKGREKERGGGEREKETDVPSGRDAAWETMGSSAYRCAFSSFVRENTPCSRKRRDHPAFAAETATRFLPAISISRR